MSHREISTVTARDTEGTIYTDRIDAAATKTVMSRREIVDDE